VAKESETLKSIKINYLTDSYKWLKKSFYPACHRIPSGRGIELSRIRQEEERDGKII